MSLDVLLITELQKKAINRGVDLNDPKQFSAFAENLVIVKDMVRAALIQVVSSYQCKNCGKVDEGCSTCGEKREAKNKQTIQAIQGITTMTTGVHESTEVLSSNIEPFVASFINEDEHY